MRQPRNRGGAEATAAHRSIMNSEVPYIDAKTEHGEIALDDLDTFVIPARDEKGTSMPVSLQVPPFLDRNMEIVISTRRFPYLRVSDLIRHAVVRHLAWLSGIRQAVPRHMVPTMAALSEMLRDEEFRLEAEQTFMKLEKVIGRHLAKGDKGEAIRLYIRFRTMLNQAEECPARDRLLSEIDTKYAPLIQIQAMPSRRLA